MTNRIAAYLDEEPLSEVETRSKRTLACLDALVATVGIESVLVGLMEVSGQRAIWCASSTSVAVQHASKQWLAIVRSLEKTANRVSKIIGV